MRLGLTTALVVLVAGGLSACGEQVAKPASIHRYDIRPGDDLFGRLGALKPGDEVVVHSGTYRTPGFLQVAWKGTARAPIVVTGAPGERRPVIVGGPSQNVINLSGSYFRLARLEVRGGSHGVRLGHADHATLDRLKVHDLGDVGISCNRPGQRCFRVAIRRSEVYDTGHTGTGEGMYLGCQDRSCTFRHGVVADNYVHDTGGEQGEGIEFKPGSAPNVIRGNRVARTRGYGIEIAGRRATGNNRVTDDNLHPHG